jgi:hypothetical protein
VEMMRRGMGWRWGGVKSQTEKKWKWRLKSEGEEKKVINHTMYLMYVQCDSAQMHTLKWQHSTFLIEVCVCEW